MAAEVGGELNIGEAVADDVGAGQVVGISRVEVLAEQPKAGLARGQALVRKAAVDQFIGKAYAFVGQDIAHELVGRPEGIFRKAGGAQAVLVGNEHQLVLGQIAGNAGQAADGPRQKLELVGREAVDLLAGLGLHENGAVAVDKQDLFQIN